MSLESVSAGAEDHKFDDENNLVEKNLKTTANCTEQSCRFSCTMLDA